MDRLGSDRRGWVATAAAGAVFPGGSEWFSAKLCRVDCPFPSMPFFYLETLPAPNAAQQREVNQKQTTLLFAFGSCSSEHYVGT